MCFWCSLDLPTVICNTDTEVEWLLYYQGCGCGLWAVGCGAVIGVEIRATLLDMGAAKTLAGAETPAHLGLQPQPSRKASAF